MRYERINHAPQRTRPSRSACHRGPSHHGSRSLNFGLGMNFSMVALARFNSTPKTGKVMRLDKAKVTV
ncbi:MAG: hypothetical protein JWN70_1848 [Planctomycetaceae bacterium]|nr:hypothetical protein [Planctomycetaceae bacterium]